MMICFKYMKSLLIQIDEPTYRALNRIAPAAKRQRAEFVRSAIRKAIREIEEERTRLAYLKQPDSEQDADDWSNAGEWKA
jgi:predicted transcriptional regulator